MGDPSKKLELVGSEYGAENASDDTATPTLRTGKWEWERAIRESDLSPRTRFVCLLIGTYMDADGSAFPSIPTIAEKCGFKSTKPVYAAKREAVAAGLLGEVKGGGRGHATRYFSVVPNGGPGDTVSLEETVAEEHKTVAAGSLNGGPGATRTDQEQTRKQTSGEDDATREFLDVIASKVDGPTRKRLAAERGARTKLGPLTMELSRRQSLGQSPRGLAGKVCKLEGVDLTRAKDSVVGYALWALRQVPDPGMRRAS